ncbi:phosphatase PAP2 family protein [Duganella callida]|uniref:Phosphatase PAP2 family protein n=1 Tax=Duganella callida TaxID=2561932 RepID=A0A4Y9S6Z4_9BURK|nr:phosphatase PAP2 family protein [Duganella callida]TFW17242.1 phosphatase PAP2 family protein [Duganella callida]
MASVRGMAAERAAWGAGLLVLWAAGYFGIGLAPARLALDTSTAWDAAVPFVGASVWIYLAGLAMMAAPLWLLPCRRLLRRTGMAYALTILVSLACFALCPASSARLRAAIDLEHMDPVSGWALRALHAIDPPTNLFPSLHVSLCALAAFALGEAAPPARPAWLACMALVAISTCTLKQHVLADVAGGLVLALAVGGLR